MSKKKLIQHLQALHKAVMKENLSGVPFLISTESFAVGYHFALLMGSLSSRIMCSTVHIGLRTHHLIRLNMFYEIIIGSLNVTKNDTKKD